MAQTVSPSTSRPAGRRGSENRWARKPCQSTATSGASRLSKLGHSHQGTEASSDFEGIQFHGTRLCEGRASVGRGYLPGSRSFSKLVSSPEVYRRSPPGGTPPD